MTLRVSRLIFVFLAVFLSACANMLVQPTPTVQPSATPSATLTFTPVPTGTPIPTTTPTPSQTPALFAEITTPAGNLTIEKVELTNQSLFDAPAPEGKQFLTVWLVRSDGTDIDVVYFLKVQPLSAQIYLISSDGTWNNLSGFGNAEGKLFVRFTVPKEMSGFQFSWPENPLIDLGK